MSAELNCSLTIWMRRERRSPCKVPDGAFGAIARGRYEFGNGLILSDSTT